MIFGYMSRWTFGEDRQLSLSEELNLACELGFASFGLNLDRLENRQLKPVEMQAIKAQAAAARLTLVVRAPHNLNTAMASNIAQFKHCISIAAYIGAQRFMLHPGNPMNKSELTSEQAAALKGKKRKDLQLRDKTIELAQKQLVSNLRQIVSFARGNRVQVGLENNGEPYQFGADLEEYITILDSVKSLDSSVSVGHANINGNNAAEFIKACRPRIINLDLHDNHGKGDEHLGLGEGRIQFKSLFALLRSKQNITAMVDTYTDGKIRKSAAYLRAMRLLRQL